MDTQNGDKYSIYRGVVFKDPSSVSGQPEEALSHGGGRGRYLDGLHHLHDLSRIQTLARAWSCHPTACGANSVSYHRQDRAYTKATNRG